MQRLHLPPPCPSWPGPPCPCDSCQCPPTKTTYFIQSEVFSDSSVQLQPHSPNLLYIQLALTSHFSPHSPMGFPHRSCMSGLPAHNIVHLYTCNSNSISWKTSVCDFSDLKSPLKVLWDPPSTLLCLPWLLQPEGRTPDFL